ncbi:MAG TPA: DNA polymerase III subunit beta, partial [Pirellulaceae bacterium]|nr:DNA polymerase III subunit beta [Pirellulaceae bacterium]
MKINCNLEKLLAAFQTAAMFAPGRSPKAILQNVKLIANPEQVTLMATDMEVGVRVKAEGIEVESAGAAVLPVGHFGAILRESNDEFLTLETNESGTTVRGARSEFKLPGADPDEFPNIADFDATSFHALPARVFKEMIQRTEFATEVESSRYALGGILLEFEPSQITAVGTDGRRLARIIAPAESVEGHKGGESNTIVRTQSMRLIGRALSDSDEYVHLAGRNNDIVIRTPRASYYSRLVEGRFPRWRDVFPQREDSAKVNLTVGPFHSALKQAAIACNNDSRGIDCTLE